MAESWPGADVLVLAAAAFSLQLAQHRSADDVALLAAFLTALADNLALIATRIALPTSEENLPVT